MLIDNTIKRNCTLFPETVSRLRLVEFLHYLENIMIICFCLISKALRMTNMERVREKINAIKVSKPINWVCNLNFIQTEKIGKTIYIKM